MTDLANAGTLRNEHEVAVHDYHHAIPVPPQHAKFAPIRGTRKPESGGS